MAIGRTRHVASDEPIRFPVGPGDLTPAAPGVIERSVGDDLWYQVTVAPADFTNGSAHVQLPSPAMKIEIFAGLGDELVIGLDRPKPSTSPGGYDLWHPSGLQLVEVVRPTTALGITTVTGAAPVDPVEIVALNGIYLMIGS